MIEILELSDFTIKGAAIQLTICVALWVLMLLAILVDLWDRIYTQKTLGKSIKSHLLRVTIDKVSEYWRFMFIAFIIDIIIFIVSSALEYKALPFASIVFCLVLLVIEFNSLLEHARERRSKLSDVNKLIQIVVNAASDKDAKKAIREIGEYLEQSKQQKNETTI